MRVLLVLSTVFHVRGGIPRFNQMLCLALDELAAELGFTGEVIVLDDTVEDWERAGRPWRRLAFTPGGGQLAIAARALGSCLRRKPRLMLIGLLGMTPVGWLCRPFLARGFGFIGHGTECWEEPRWTRRHAAGTARFAFAVSTHTAAAVQRTIGLPAAAVRLLPNTLDPGFEHLPSDGLEPEKPMLLTVSRLWADEGKKGVDHTLRAFARLLARHPEASYRIVGKGSDRPRLEALAAELKLDGRVVFESDLSDGELAERYRRCSVFVLPSGQEGFGIVFLEAMRFSKPCVGGDAGGTPDVIRNEETGLLVPFGDEQALEAALDRLLGDASLRRRLGRAGRERLEREFVFSRFRERLRGHLQELLECADSGDRAPRPRSSHRP
jgi:glycosyltransferase involved in cell wall biosynthesis